MLPKKQPLYLMQDSWATQLDPVISNPWLQGQLLTGISLINGTTVVNHKLGRTPLGWTLVSPQAAATVHQAVQQPNPSLTLTLVSNAAVTTSLWVF